MVKTVESIQWDSQQGAIKATTDLRIGNIILQSKSLNHPDPEKIIQKICGVVQKEGAHLLDFKEEVQQWQNRVLSLRKWRPEEEWPDVSTPKLLETCTIWLSPYLTGVKKGEELKYPVIQTFNSNTFQMALLLFLL